jgi:hypothetical protein
MRFPKKYLLAGDSSSGSRCVCGANRFRLREIYVKWRVECLDDALL